MQVVVFRVYAIYYARTYLHATITQCALGCGRQFPENVERMP